MLEEARKRVLIVAVDAELDGFFEVFILESGAHEGGFGMTDADGGERVGSESVVGGSGGHADGFEDIAFSAAIFSNKNIDASERESEFVDGFEIFDTNLADHSFLRVKNRQGGDEMGKMLGGR